MESWDAVGQAQVRTRDGRGSDVSAPFPRWSNSVFRVSLVALPAFVLSIPLLLMAYVRTPLYHDEGEPREQPIEFDHRHHVRDDGISCRYCHFDAWRAPTAGIPSTELCMNCHAQIWNQSPLLEPVRRSWFEGEPLVWQRVNQLPDFVYFNHMVHVRQGVGCETCHGRVDLMPKVQQAVSLQMDWCIECHVSPERYLRPPEEVQTMGWEPPVPQTVIGQALVAELNIHAPIRCSACHR